MSTLMWNLLTEKKDKYVYTEMNIAERCNTHSIAGVDVSIGLEELQHFLQVPRPRRP